MEFIDDDRLFNIANDSYILGICLNINCDRKQFDEIYKEECREALAGNRFRVIFDHNERVDNYSNIDYNTNLGAVLRTQNKK